MNKTDLTTAFEQTSFLYGGNAQFIEQLYDKYLDNPSSVDPAWRQFFTTLQDGVEDATRGTTGPSWQRSDWPQARRQRACRGLRRQLARGTGEARGQGARRRARPPASASMRCARRRSIPSAP